MHNYFVYILTNDFGNVIYVGVTSDLEKRMAEHLAGAKEGFSRKYNLKKLVYFEHFTDIEAAISLEKEIKKWRREKKNRLVEVKNPDWKDITADFGMRFLTQMGSK